METVKDNRTTGGINPDSKMHYRAIVINMACSWHKNRRIDQWNQFEGPHINPYMHGHLTFDKAMKTHWK